ncbi:MAG: hypothetical protein AB7O49_11185 [Sphingomonadales bacterium]
MAARFRESWNLQTHDRLRGGNACSVAAKTGEAGAVFDHPPGGVFGQARRHAEPGAGRRGGEGRGCEYPSIAARQALAGVLGLLTILLLMGWPVLVIGLAIANPPPAGVFAYLTRPDDLTRTPVLNLPDVGSWGIAQ